jgi:putative ABC transport system permease protein
MEVGSPTFFATMGIPLRSGRVFSDRDRRGAPRVVMLSEAAARAIWPGDDAVGKRVRGAGDEWWTVVGVVADTRYREFRTPRATVYFPLLQLPFPYPPTNLVVRTSGEPALMTATLRRTIAKVDPDLVLSRATTMTSLLDEPLAQQRLNAMLLAVFALVVVVLAAVGLYGVLAWTVRQRTRELGIRIALGAQPRQLQLLVLRRGLLIAAAGAIAGLVGALGASRVLQALLYEISPTDPLTMMVASALLITVAAAACLIPARRATRVDPLVALRAE